MQPLVLLALLALMYFMLIRPQQQRARAQRALVTSLQEGDEVFTVGGLVGRIVRLDDEHAEIETLPGTVLRFRRMAIAGRVPQAQRDDAHEHESSENNGEAK